MLNEKLQERYNSYWNCANRTALFTARIADDVYQVDQTREWWMSVDAQLAKNDWQMEHVHHFGDAYPLMCPNLGPDFFGACLGLELKFGTDTSWSIHDPDLCNPDEYRAPVLRDDNIYYRTMQDMTQAFCEHGKGRYFTGITDLHPGADGLMSFRGSQQLCFDTVEDPEFVAQAIMDLLDPFKAIFDRLCTITEAYQKGTSNWMGVWHPGRQYVTSCDFATMISPAAFQELCLKELQEELKYLDASIFHMDGPGVMRHVDTILQQQNLKGVQWVYGAGQPTAAHWLDLLHKIQEAGKMVHIDAYPSDVPLLLKELRPEGLLINLVGATMQEAQELEELARRR